MCWGAPGVLSLPELRPRPDRTMGAFVSDARALPVPFSCFSFLYGTCHHPVDRTFYGLPPLLVCEPCEGSDFGLCVHRSLPCSWNSAWQVVVLSNIY